MQTLLLFLIVLLTVVICALAGFWILRPDPVYKRKARVPQPVPRAIREVPRTIREVPWTITGRPFRDRA